MGSSNKRRKRRGGQPAANQTPHPPRQESDHPLAVHPAPRAAIDVAGGMSRVNPPPAEAIYMTYEQAAELLNVSTRHIRRQVDAGDFPRPIRFGGKMLFSTLMLGEWLNRKHREAEAAPTKPARPKP